MASFQTNTVPNLSTPPPFPTILFDPTNVDRRTMFQVYCLNHPPGSCEFGSCPNSDVTGIGQQASIYITSITFIISLIYCLPLVRPMLYAHLGLVYSLLIATVTSARSSQLTQNDALFVLVTVASPGSFAIWTLTIWSLWDPSQFPIRKSKRKSLEVLLLKLSCLGSLVFEIAMVCVTFVPSSGLRFSQPACNKRYAGKLWIELLWELPYLVQTVWMVFMVIGTGLLFGKKIGELPHSIPSSTPAESEWVAWRNDAHSDMVTWVEESLARIPHLSTPAGSLTMRSILATIQLCALPNIGFIFDHNILILALLVIAPILDRSPSNISIPRRSIVGMIACVAFGCNLIYGNFPTCPDVVLVFVCAIIFQKRFYLPNVRPAQIYLIKLCFFSCSVIVAFGGDLLAWLLSVNSLASMNSGKPLDVTDQPLILNIFVLPLWMVGWLATSVWPMGVGRSYKNIWEVTVSRAHLLKAGLLVITPNSLWIQASIAANPTKSTDMTFGQVFALIVSVVTFLSLMDVARNVERNTWRAFFLSERMPIDDKTLSDLQASKRPASSECYFA